jgi:hypothetical protein
VEVQLKIVSVGNSSCCNYFTSSEMWFSSSQCGIFTGEEFSKREIKVRTREEEEDEIKEADKMNEAGVGTEKGDRGDGTEKDEGVGKDAEGKDEGEATVIGNLRFRVPKYNPEVAVGELH